MEKFYPVVCKSFNVRSRYITYKNFNIFTLSFYILLSDISLHFQIRYVDFPVGLIPQIFQDNFISISDSLEENILCAIENWRYREIGNGREIW